MSPHADDETLGCGALVALLAPTHDIHIIFATDSSRSPENPHHPGADRERLARVRESEAAAAMSLLGVPREQLHFLRFPDARLQQHAAAFRTALVDTLTGLGATDVLVPFRYDWHKDHLAVHAAAVAALRARQFTGRLTEYFVYTQRRLLAGGDVRAHLDPSQVIRVAASSVASLKMRALECYASQTTLYFDWQTRPILTPQLLRRMCAEPECFLPYEPVAGRVLRRATWIRLASAIEPPLKRLKDGMFGYADHLFSSRQ